MNKHAIGPVFLLSFLAACASAPPPPPPPPTPALPVCKMGPMPPPCDRGQPPHIMLSPGKTMAAPARYCVAAGGTVVFKVAGDPAKASVATVPENPFQIWMYGSNAADATTFSVQVPVDQPLGDYKYKVYFANDCLDPMITVTP